MTISALNKNYYLQTRLLSFLSPEERDQLAQTNKAWRNAEETVSSVFLNRLKSQIDEDCFGDEACHLFIADETGRQKEQMGCVLGKGGSKKAIKLGGKQRDGKHFALIVCNLDGERSGFEHVARSWKRFVHEEVAMSKFLSSLDLLSPQYRRVNISLSSTAAEGVMPAYISETFSSLGKSNEWFVIDVKIRDSSSWRWGECFLFSRPEDRLVERNWDGVFDSMMTDIAKICVYDIPVNEDSLNFVIAKKPIAATSASPFEARYFGFDFSSKDRWLSIPKNLPKRQNTEIEKATSNWILSRCLDYVFWYEFGNKYLHNAEGMRADLTALLERLKERFTKEISARMEKICFENIRNYTECKKLDFALFDLNQQGAKQTASKQIDNSIKQF